MEYAYYNRGTIYAKANDYHSAVADFTKAIEINDKLAEAYYNRALVYVFQNKIDDAIKDLSRAGELGLYQAYNIIKRFSYTD
jgi:tetratricopeptide (TPR) repeat protein